MNRPSIDEVKSKLAVLSDGFQKFMYEDDDIFLSGMQSRNLAGDDIGRYRFWEWPQGVGLYSYWMLFADTGEQKYLDVLIKYYDQRLACGLPAKNVNTTAPLLAMSYLAEYTKDPRYFAVCDEWAEYILNGFPRTVEGGLQHITSDTVNDQELWDDTLFMTVLFLANMGRIRSNEAYKAEAEYQFLIHAKYLIHRETGLWYHGWTFAGSHHFAGALWGRGNCWITAAIPAYLQMEQCSPAVARYLTHVLRRQVEALSRLQDAGGMWHTLLDDPNSYVETSATCGIAYGILQAVRQGLIDEKYLYCAQRALLPVLEHISADGTVLGVSYGTAMGRESKQFYRDIPIKSMPYGQALAILFFMACLHSFDHRS